MIVGYTKDYEHTVRAFGSTSGIFRVDRSCFVRRLCVYSSVLANFNQIKVSVALFVGIFVILIAHLFIVVEQF